MKPYYIIIKESIDRFLEPGDSPNLVSANSMDKLNSNTGSNMNVNNVYDYIISDVKLKRNKCIKKCDDLLDIDYKQRCLDKCKQKKF